MHRKLSILIRRVNPLFGPIKCPSHRVDLFIFGRTQQINLKLRYLQAITTDIRTSAMEDKTQDMDTTPTPASEFSKETSEQHTGKRVNRNRKLTIRRRYSSVNIN
jgi:hypothetical protein